MTLWKVLCTCELTLQITDGTSRELDQAANAVELGCEYDHNWILLFPGSMAQLFEAGNFSPQLVYFNSELQ